MSFSCLPGSDRPSVAFVSWALRRFSAVVKKVKIHPWIWAYLHSIPEKPLLQTWLHACFNWFEHGSNCPFWEITQSMITSLLLLMPYSKKSLHFLVVGCFPSLSFRNVNSWWVVYLVENEQLDTFSKQECQNLSLQAPGTNHSSPMLCECLRGLYGFLLEMAER